MHQIKRKLLKHKLLYALALLSLQSAPLFAISLDPLSGQESHALTKQKHATLFTKLSEIPSRPLKTGADLISYFELNEVTNTLVQSDLSVWATARSSNIPGIQNAKIELRAQTQPILTATTLYLIISNITEGCLAEREAKRLFRKLPRAAPPSITPHGQSPIEAWRYSYSDRIEFPTWEFKTVFSGGCLEYLELDIHSKYTRQKKVNSAPLIILPPPWTPDTPISDSKN